jgi:hypothetical protein
MDLIATGEAGLRMQEVKVQRVQVTSDLQAHVSAMHLAADTTTLPYDRVSHWVQKLDEIDLQILPTLQQSEPAKTQLPAKSTLEIIQQKRAELANRVIASHRKLELELRDLKADHQYAKYFGLVFGEGWRMERSGLLKRVPGLYSFDRSLDEDVSDLITWAAAMQSDLSARELQNSARML